MAAGNNSIQILRCTSSVRSSSTTVLSEGQPMIETDTNRLYVGDGSTQAKNLKPVKPEIYLDSDGYLCINT